MSNPEDRNRKPFTKGWAQTLSRTEALPIKRGGKLVTVYKAKEKKAKKTDEDEMEEKIIDVSDDEAEEETEDKVVEDPKEKKKPESLEEKFFVEFNTKSDAELNLIKERIADICSHITANPEECFSRRSSNKKDGAKNDDGDEEESTYHIQELFDMALSHDAQVVELALLSTALIFKDICPGYRIRNIADRETADQMKKETWKLMSYEKSMLTYYQRFVNILDKRTTWGIGSIQSSLSKVRKNGEEAVSAKDPQRWNLGFVSFTCQCELLKSLHHFNFRSLLLSSITLRIASERDEMLINHGCEVLKSILTNDHNGEFSFEMVSLMSKILKLSKYLLPSKLLEVLESVKVTIRAEESRRLQAQAKLSRKKRRKLRDEVELGLLEANANSDEVNYKRYQVNSLQEIALIYFR